MEDWTTQGQGAQSGIQQGIAQNQPVTQQGIAQNQQNQPVTQPGLQTGIQSGMAQNQQNSQNQLITQLTQAQNPISNVQLNSQPQYKSSCMYPSTAYMPSDLNTLNNFLSNQSVNLPSIPNYFLQQTPRSTAPLLYWPMSEENYSTPQDLNVENKRLRAFIEKHEKRVELLETELKTFKLKIELLEYKLDGKLDGNLDGNINRNSKRSCDCAGECKRGRY